MELSDKQLKVIADLDDGSLYASPDIIRELFRYPYMRNPRLLLSHDYYGKVNGYLPVGEAYTTPTLSYIAAMPNSPPICPSYTPGADKILRRLIVPFFDTDVVADLPYCRQVETASAMILPLPDYLQSLSPERRRDIKRKLKKAERYQMLTGNLQDVFAARHWLIPIWQQRPLDFDLNHVKTYVAILMSWLSVVQRSGRAVVRVRRYQLDGQTIGVNCCVLHKVGGHLHCDDYLTWYDPEIAAGLGISSAVHNLTDSLLYGCRYNLGNPGVGAVHHRHAYKFDLLPPALRLTQAVFDTRQQWNPAVRKAVC